MPQAKNQSADLYLEAGPDTCVWGYFDAMQPPVATVDYPRAAPPRHYLAMGMDPDLDRCAEMAVRDRMSVICARGGLSREDAYMPCSLAGDLRITPTVNGGNGGPMTLAKSLLERATG